jgi:uncharacterized protein with HEPN domain
MKKDDFVYLGHVVDSISKIQSYLEGMSYDDFVADEFAIDAVVRNLEIIGEAMSNVNASFFEEHKEIPIKDIVSMRNRLIHEYFGVKVDVVWDTCHQDLPILKNIIANLI